MTEAFLDEFQHLKIQLEEIKSATDNFSENNVIGRGGFGIVYKGEISDSNGQIIVAIKRLDSKLGQGNTEFWKEITMLSRYSHTNLISLVGFCDQDGEKIIVYEHASNGSLDSHLNSTTLTWTQRIKICLDVARGLNHLHDHSGTQQRVIHRDIKSSNILLDKNWNAKVSDLGLSKVGPANQQHTVVVSNVVGTLGYLDPLYMEMGILSKEADIYSFGVVLFEVLCGRLCFENSNGNFHSLVHLWKKNYMQKKLDEIIFQDPSMKQMDSTSLETFSSIAFLCLHKSRKERPTIANVVEKLEIALEKQKFSESLLYYHEITRTVVPRLNYRSKVELNILLSKGVLLYDGKMWFSLNENGQHCEMISIAECLIPDANQDESHRYSSSYNSRFAVGSYETYNKKFKTYVRTQFLSPLTTYTVNLVFKLICKNKPLSNPQCICLKYKLEEETKYSLSCFADKREDEWLTTELYQFISDGRSFDHKIQFEDSDINFYTMVVEGIEFRPLEKVENEVVDIEPISDSDIDWEQKLPDDYEDIIKWSKDIVKWTMKKELYFVLCKGFLVNNGEEWFSLSKNGKKCRMLSPRVACVKESYTYWRWESLPESRFGEALMIYNRRFSIVAEINSQILSPQTTYACYLIYKITEDQLKHDGLVKVRDKDLGSDDWNDFWLVYLCSPVKGKVDQKTDSLLNTHSRKGLPEERSDSWMEVQVWKFQTSTIQEMIPLGLELGHSDMFSWFIIKGIEFRPI